MATALQHITECSVCTNEFTDPKVLPCDHTFCQMCIDHIKRGSRIKCPVCSRVHDVRKVRPDFELTQFIDALKEMDTSGKVDEAKDVVCEICSDETATHWCDSCKQWLGKICTKGHRKIPALQGHKLIHLSIKCRQVKSEYAQEVKYIKDVFQEYTLSIQNIQDQIGNIETTQDEALGKSNMLRRNMIQEINTAFDAIDAKIITFLYSKINCLEEKQSKLQTELNNMNLEWIQLENMIGESSSIVATKGQNIINQAKEFMGNLSDIRIQIQPVSIGMSVLHKWNAESMVHTEMSGGSIETTGVSLIKSSDSSFTEAQKDITSHNTLDTPAKSTDLKQFANMNSSLAKDPTTLYTAAERKRLSKLPPRLAKAKAEALKGRRLVPNAGNTLGATPTNSYSVLKTEGKSEELHSTDKLTAATHTSFDNEVKNVTGETNSALDSKI